jgi:hypothetical protein
MFETRFYSSPIFWKTGKQKMSAQVKLVFLNSFFIFCSLGDPSCLGLYKES